MAHALRGVEKMVGVDSAEQFNPSHEKGASKTWILSSGHPQDGSIIFDLLNEIEWR
jgi:hypothetical protein